MAKETFINILERYGYSYSVEGDKIIMGGKDPINLPGVKRLPTNVVFQNNASVQLGDVEYIPEGTVFKNDGIVYLPSLKKIHPSVILDNNESIYLGFLAGRWLDLWDGNIVGIDSKRLLNSMINKGVFYDNKGV